MKNIYYIFALFFIVGCTPNKYMFDMTKPGSPQMKWIYDHPPKSGDKKASDPLYLDGWRDGCETGASANTNSFYRYMNDFKQDAMKAQNDIYYKGWKDAFNYCGRYIYQYNRRTGF